MSKIAFITGICGQDGSYLLEFLLDKGYIVYGMMRRSSMPNSERIDHIFPNQNLNLRYGDMTDQNSINKILAEIKESHVFDVLEIYNLAAQSHVLVSYKIPVYTTNVDAMGVLYLLESVRDLGLEKVARVYQASSSEIYGEVLEIPQTEKTPFNPRSPYAVAKEYSFKICKLYRDAYGMFISNGILFNHESPRRAVNFVTRKITRGVGKIIRGEAEVLTLGNLNSLRDWGHSKDYVRAMWMILQSPIPDDFVIATGEQHSVREFVEKTFERSGIKIRWEGSGENEKGIDENTGIVRVKVDAKYFRPCEVETLLGDATKAKEILGWSPEYSFDDLVSEMCEEDF